MDPSVALTKAVAWHSALGKHQVSMVGIPAVDVLREHAPAESRATSSASRRAGPISIFFHTGIVAFGNGGNVVAPATRRKAEAACWMTTWRRSFKTNTVKYVHAGARGGGEKDGK